MNRRGFLQALAVVPLASLMATPHPTPTPAPDPVGPLPGIITTDRVLSEDEVEQLRRDLERCWIGTRYASHQDTRIFQDEETFQRVLGEVSA